MFGESVHELAATPFENVLQDGLHQEAIYRSVDVATFAPPQLLCPYQLPSQPEISRFSGLGDRKLQFGGAGADWDIKLVSINESLSPAKIEAPSQRVCAEAPVYLAPTHFECSKSLSDIENILNDFFNFQPHLTFACDSNEFRWSLMLVNGASSCKLELNIYDSASGSEGDSYLIEVNKLRGVSDLYNNFFNDLRSKFHSCNDDSARYDSFCAFTPSPSIPVYNESLCPESIESIFKMAGSRIAESMHAASEMLCDLSFHHEFQDFLLEKDSSFLVFTQLIASGISDVQRKTIAALNTISESQFLQRRIISSGILLQLLSLVCGELSSYETIDICRSCSCIIANIASNFPSDVVAAIGESNFKLWLQKTNSIDDKKLQILVRRVATTLLK